MEEIIKLAGVCMTAVCASLILKDRHGAAAVLCSTAAALVIVLVTVGGAVGEVVSTLESIYSGTYFFDYAEVMIKALGIAYITAGAAEICNAAGEAGLARTVGLAGRCELLLLCLPMISKLLGIAGEMLENV